MSSSARFITRGRLCLASDGPDLVSSLLTNNVHRAATRRDCGLSWSPSQPAKAAALATLWESALNTDDDLSFSPETMKQLRSPKPKRTEGTCNICLDLLEDDRMGCHGCSMVAHPRCLSRWFNGQPASAKDADPEAFPSMVKQVEKGACPLCRRELDWNTMVEYMRHVKANKLDIDGGKYGEDARAVPYSLRSNTAVAARAGALGEVGHVEGAYNTSLPAPTEDFGLVFAGIAVPAHCTPGWLLGNAVSSDQGAHGSRRRRDRRIRLIGNAGVDKRNRRLRVAAAQRERRDGNIGSRTRGSSGGVGSGMRSEWSTATEQALDDSFESLC